MSTTSQPAVDGLPAGETPKRSLLVGVLLHSAVLINGLVCYPGFQSALRQTTTRLGARGRSTLHQSAE